MSRLTINLLTQNFIHGWNMRNKRAWIICPHCLATEAVRDDDYDHPGAFWCGACGYRIWA